MTDMRANDFREQAAELRQEAQKELDELVKDIQRDRDQLACKLLRRDELRQVIRELTPRRKTQQGETSRNEEAAGE